MRSILENKKGKEDVKTLEDKVIKSFIDIYRMVIKWLMLQHTLMTQK